MFDDSQDLREENDRLKRRLSEYETIFDSSPIMFWFKDTKNRLLRINRAAAELEGLEPARVVGRRAEDLYPPEQAAAYYADDLEVIRSGKPRVGIVEPHTTPGSDEVRWLHVGKVPSRDADGTINGVIAFAMDVTELRTLERELQQKRKLETIGQLAGGVAHDFNNVLAAIMGSAELALLHKPPGPPGERLREILDACERAKTLTSQLLAYSRKSSLNLSLCDVRRCVERVLLLLRRSVDPRISVGHVDEASETTLRGDPGALEGALLNLTLNARDAIRDKGRVTIHLADHPQERKQELPFGQSLVPGHYLRIAVSDTGTGIDPDALPQLFDPFFTTKDVGKGTGLGLPAVLGTAQSHGGAVVVETVLDEGSTFSLYLPVALGAQEAAPAHSLELEPGNGTILLVDDEPQLREVGQKLISKAGYDVLVAEDGVEALAVCEQSPHPVRLVILDVTMPRMNGPDTLRALRERFPEIRAIFVTGHDTHGALSNDDGLGSCEVLQKPYRTAELTQAVARALNLR